MENEDNCRITYIYGLYEVGKEDEIRYIGKSNNPKSRTYSHIYVSMKTKIKPTYKECWIRKVLNDKGKIGYRILEEVTYDNWSEREVYWISNTENLTNTSPGGETGITGKQFEISYDDCKKWVSENLPNVKKSTDWREMIKMCNIPSHIPKSPHIVFRDEWVSWSDFLMSNNISCNVKSKKYLSYDECKIWFKENINITDVKSWNSLCKTLPYFIPKKPTEHFNDIWNKNSWIDLTGVDFSPKKYISHSEAHEFAMKIKLNSSTEWIKYHKENKKNIPNIPVNVNVVYKKDWISWSYFLGYKPKGSEISKNLLKYDILCKYVEENLKFIKTQRDWIEYVKEFDFLPRCPQHVYKDKGWVSWNTFLHNNKYKRGNNFLEFTKAREIVSRLKFKTHKEWREWSKNKEEKYNNIPCGPDLYYKSEWCGWNDWLGK